MSSAAVNPSYSLKQLPLYGRRYQIQVLLPPNQGSQQVITLADSSFEPEALRVTFEVEMWWWHFVWYATIVAYNLDFNTATAILAGAGPQGGGVSGFASPTNTPAGNIPVKQGMSCIISAGYDPKNGGNYGVIWNGPVFQAWIGRENVTDLKLVLHCILGLDPAYRAQISTPYAALTQQSNILQDIAKAAYQQSGGGGKLNLSANFANKTLSRGKTVFGRPAKYFTQAAEDNNMQWFLDDKGITLARIDDSDLPVSPPIVYIPRPQPGLNYNPPANAIPGLIGTPVQTQDGVDCRVLLNPNIKIARPATQITLDMTSIQILKKTIGTSLSQLGILDQTGTYIVCGLRHIGDTRGNNWYTDITGITSVGGRLAMARAFNAALNAG